MATRSSGDTLRIVNKKAYHDYSVHSRLECGLCLHGTEVKSLRASRVSFAGAYAEIRDGELWLIGLHVSEYLKRGYAQHEVLRTRKLLVHSQELRKLMRQISEKGMTLIPLALYEKKHRLKLELGVCKGKKEYDKRQTLKERDQKQEMKGQHHE